MRNALEVITVGARFQPTFRGSCHTFPHAIYATIVYFVALKNISFFTVSCRIFILCKCCSYIHIVERMLVLISVSNIFHTFCIHSIRIYAFHPFHRFQSTDETDNIYNARKSLGVHFQPQLAIMF